MERPICIITTLVEEPALKVAETYLSGFLSSRLNRVARSESTSWELFANQVCVSDLNEILKAALDVADGKRRPGQGGFALHLQSGVALRKNRETEATTDAMVAEQRPSWVEIERWELLIRRVAGTIVIDLMLDRALPMLERGATYDEWCDLHKAHCRALLKMEQADCIWNGFAVACEFEHLKDPLNEYWGEEEWLKKALSSKLLLTDDRTEKQKWKILSQIGLRQEVTTFLDTSKAGKRIISICDTAETLTIFEMEAPHSP